MGFDVSSRFIEESEALTPNVFRKLSIAGLEVTSSVVKWPRVRRQWDSLRPATVSVNILNSNQQLNFLINSPGYWVTSCSLSTGFYYGVNSLEATNQVYGIIDRGRFSKNTFNLTFSDESKRLSERVLGSRETPLDYTGSSYLPSDIAWYLVTSYGGFDTTPNSSNTDIDWQSFTEWAEVFSQDNVRIKAYFEGLKTIEGLRKIERLTHSTIFFGDSKLIFSRLSIVNSFSTVVDNSNIIDYSLDVRVSDIVNKFYVNADYNVDSSQFGITVSHLDSDSMVDYGLREEVEEDTNVWYVDSASALNLAQRIILARKNPYNNFTLKTNLKLVPNWIGDTLLINQDDFNVAGDYYRITSTEYDIQNSIVSVEANDMFLSSVGSGGAGAFTLDVSALDSVDILL